MKKQIQTAALFIAVLVAFASCSSVKKLPEDLAGKARARFVGVWALTKVSYDGSSPGNIQSIFEQGTPEDFNSSTWNLTNSGNGTYTLTNGTVQNIFWSYSNTNGEVFQFKKLNGESARKVQDGYVLTVDNINATNMTLRSPVNLGGTTVYIIFSFDKTR